MAEYRLPAKVELATLWASTMFRDIYGDYFGLYVADTLADMNHRSMGLQAMHAGVLTDLSLMMVIPSLMVVLSGKSPTIPCAPIKRSTTT